MCTEASVTVVNVLTDRLAPALTLMDTLRRVLVKVSVCILTYSQEGVPVCIILI